jgi:hypothetical protein
MEPGPFAKVRLPILLRHPVDPFFRVPDRDILFQFSPFFPALRVPGFRRPSSSPYGSGSALPPGITPPAFNTRCPPAVRRGSVPGSPRKVISNMLIPPLCK